VEWVETTGKTLAEAKEQALDQLGVAEDEAEFEVVEEEKTGLFGRVRREARVRARVRPLEPRPKTERRRSGRERSRGGRAGGNGRDKRAGGRKRAEKPAGKAEKQPEKQGPSRSGPTRARPSEPRRDRAPRGRREPAENQSTKREEKRTMGEPVELEQQGELVEDFLDGLLEAFGLDGELSREAVDDETVEVRIEGDDLGLLIGPRGNTLQAIQELARAAVQCRSDGPLEGRLRVDVAGYRERRRSALGEFAHRIADEVKAEGGERALEPMSAADRKIVHDAVNEIDGVSTVSEGEEPRRRVVIVAD
jgi:spoIIIJ-associated protein